ncbi:MAG: O-methyltransferase [Planctomycetota bacterium]|nr:O-methyltransferase [Planctomycetota bacterium]
MSDHSNVLSGAHFEYIAARTRKDDPFLEQLKATAREQGIPAIWVAPEQAAFLRILLRAAKVRDVVEVGTLAGYSAIQMARALPDGGRVQTIELEPKHVAFAREWIAKSDVADKVTVLEGRAADVLATLPANSADAAFIDADKTNYPTYLEHALRIVRTGGLVLVDNAFAFGQVLERQPRDREAPAIQRFNEVMAGEKRLESVIVPLGDGVWVGVKT